MIIVDPSVELIGFTEDAEIKIESSGRICYQSSHKVKKGSEKEFIRMLLSRGHESVIEHGMASFTILCDRGITHELVRHRLCSFSQESSRWCNYSKARFGNQIKVIQPPGLVENPKAFTAWIQCMGVCERSYLGMLHFGIKPEIARSVLPTCLASQITVSANLRQWRTVMKQRTSPAAHPQMREIAFGILQGLKRVAPTVFEEFDFDPSIKAVECKWSYSTS